MTSSSSLPLSLTSPSSSGNWEYDVFPSFHGPDVRKAFLSHVLKEFRGKAINLFIDNDIKRGEFIGPELKRAIRGSKIAVVLLSKNYASSSWCLDELVEIIRKELGQIVITIFYDVDPTDVKKQTKHFGKVFRKTCKGKDKGKKEKWRKALEDVANIAGSNFFFLFVRDDEASMIQKIAVDISDRLNDLTPSRDFENCIGLENHMERMNLLLRLDLDEVRMIGIWGPPGIGKSTIVRFLFNQISDRFENSALMVDIRRSYQYPKICSDEYKAKLQLENEMLSKMIKQRDVVVGHLGVAQQRLKNKKILLVLDDVDRLAQLDNVEWCGRGSRIIITTEDRRLLKAKEINHIYRVNYPPADVALEMFCMYAFQKKSPEDGFDELAREITYLVGELPLGLEVMGSYFCGLCKDKEQWSMEVSRLRNNLNGDIESVLKFSYDSLCDEDKDLFLQIACFFNGQELIVVQDFLAPRFKDLRQKLYVLEDKSLISIDHLDVEYVFMHKLLVQLGEKIVRAELINESGKHQFLNDYKDVCQMFTGKKMTMRKDGLFHERNFRVVYDSGHPIVIHWWDFPFTCLEFTNNLEFLVELHLPDSSLEKLWDGTKLLRNLEVLNLLNSKSLKELPNLSMATNLEELDLYGCSSLVSLPHLPESLSNLKGCSSRADLPSSIGNTTNLLQLNLRYCSSLVKLPSSIWWNATTITEINLERCSSLLELPSSIGNAYNLRKLNLEGCFSLVSLPQLPESLTDLNAKYCESLEKLDCSFGNARLNFSNCFNLNKEARDLIIHTSTLEYAVLPGKEKEVPECFTYRAFGSCVTVKLNEKHLPASTKFKACILVVYTVEDQTNLEFVETLRMFCSITSKQKNAITACTTLSEFADDILTEHLYIFDVEAEEVPSNELDFTFEIPTYDHMNDEIRWDWEIKGCGVLSMF